MSSQAKKLQKTIENTLRFEADAYWNFFTSYAICSYILNDKGDIKNINKVHKRLKRNPDEIKIDDKDWLKKLAELYGVEYDLTGRIVLVQGLHNMFFLIADEDGNVYTTREDHVYPLQSLDQALANKSIFRLTSEDYNELKEL